MSIPDDLRYSNDHEWVRVEGDLVRVGITDFAQDNLGDVVYVQLPDLGAALGAGSSFGEIESTKSVSDLYAPIDGTVVEVNGELEATPELVNSDPYGDGWICLVKPTDLAQVDGLLDAAAYQAILQD